MTDTTTVMSAVAPVAEGEFRIGRVFSRTVTLLSRNFPIYFVIAALAALPAVVLEHSGAQKGGAGQLLGFVLMAVLGPLSQAIMMHAASQDMRGDPVSLSESVRFGLGRWLPLIGLSLCLGLAIGMGFLLLIVPGFILMAMWYVATPACIVERLGVSASFARSSALTKGHRWQVFGMMLLIAIPEVVIAAVIKAVLGLTGSAGLVMSGSLVWAGLAGAFGAIFVVVIYHDLRAAKEGVDVSHLAAVFD